MKHRSLLRRLFAPVLTAALAASVAGATMSAVHANPRIVGGTTVLGADHPWQVQLWGPQQSTLCGGVLIAPTLVLTAAHCVVDDPSLAGYTMYAGRTALTSGGERLSFTATSYWVGPNYNASTMRDDWAMIQLSSPASATPLHLPSDSEASAWTSGTDAVVSGWGLTSEGGDISSTLRAVTVPILSDSTCKSTRVYGSDYDSNTMLCAGDMAGGEDACNGDSGGPLQVTTAAGEPRLAGLVSWGSGCARSGYPGVYTRVAGTTIRQQILSTIATQTSVDPASVVGAGTATASSSASASSSPSTSPSASATSSPTSSATSTTTPVVITSAACTAATLTLASLTTRLKTAWQQYRDATDRLKAAKRKLQRLRDRHRSASTIRHQRQVVAYRRGISDNASNAVEALRTQTVAAQNAQEAACS